MEFFMFRTVAFTLTMAAAVPAAAQAAKVAAVSQAPAKVTPFNQAVAQFTAGQAAQQAGDNVGALAKYELALPTIRSAVQTDPTNVNNVNFLANTLYAASAAKAGLSDIPGMLALYTESVPYWRTVLASKPGNQVTRQILGGILVQLGNAKLAAPDKAGADILYNEAIGLARDASTLASASAKNRNLLLSALIGATHTNEDPGVKEEAITLAKVMIANGSVDAGNKPSAQILAGS
jgi:tetratricopeptide (TPR) repeat protein